MECEMASVDLTSSVLQWAPRTEWIMRPLQSDQAALVASWIPTLEDLRWVAPCTPPPLDAVKVLEWRRSYVEPFIFYDPDNIPAAYGELVPSQTHADEMWIAHVVVDPRRRNEGIGRRFIQCLLDKSFAEMNARGVCLSVFCDNISGRACYRRAGLRECGSRRLRPVWLTEEEPLVDMRIERFDWLARRWKEALAVATHGAPWRKYYRLYRRLRFAGDPMFRERLEVMFSTAGPVVREGEFEAADLGCGTGCLAEEMARRFPNATIWGFDADPLAVLMGESALRGEYGDRIRFELADLRDSAWGFGREAQFKLAVSSLSRHWMSRESLRRLYHTVGGTLRSNGVFANSDHVPPDSTWSSNLFSLSGGHRTRATVPAAAQSCFPWRSFWKRVKSELGIETLCEQMAADLPVNEGAEQGFTFRFHQLALRNAGFAVVREMWRDRGEAVIVGYK